MLAQIWEAPVNYVAIVLGNNLFLYCGLLNVKLKRSWTIKTFSFQRRFNWAKHHDCLCINYAETVTRGINWQLRNTAKVYQPVLKSLILLAKRKAEWTHLFTEGPFMRVTFYHLTTDTIRQQVRSMPKDTKALHMAIKIDCEVSREAVLS